MLIDEKHESSFRIYFSVVDQLITFLRSLSTNVNDTPTKRKETGGEKRSIEKHTKEFMDQTNFVYVQSFFTETHFFPSANRKRVQCLITSLIAEISLGKKCISVTVIVISIFISLHFPGPLDQSLIKLVSQILLQTLMLIKYFY